MASLNSSHGFPRCPQKRLELRLMYNTAFNDALTCTGIHLSHFRHSIVRSIILHQSIALNLAISYISDNMVLRIFFEL